MSKQPHLKKYDVILMFENTTLLTIQNESKTLPTDVHLVKYVDDTGDTKLDAVRAHSMSDIYDAYYDFNIKTVQSITSGYGTLKPRLYNPPVEPKE